MENIDLERAVLDLVRRPDYQPAKARGIAQQLGLPRDQVPEVKKTIKRLVSEGRLVYATGRHVEAVDPARPQGNRLVGVFRRMESGSGFVRPRRTSVDDAPPPDVYVPARGSGDASTGDTVLVQLGDILSRGDDERRILDLLARLAEEARLVGGEVIVLIGNHELMAAQGDFRYVTPGALAAWAELADPSAPCPATLPPAACGRALAFAPGGPMARRLATFPMVAQVDGSLFVHGGLLPEHLDAGIDALNDQARAFFSGAVSEPGPALAGPRSPLWVRALGEEPPDCAAVAQTLAMTGARRLVVGHTLQANGIQPACAGTLWRIETGLSAVYGRKVQVLEVRGDLVRVLP